MKASIVTIGDEILIGQIVDTNSGYIAKALDKIGVQTTEMLSISDDKNHILDTFASLQDKVDLVIITGGLGPTKDDITKKTFCDYFEDVFVRNQEVEDHIVALFTMLNFIPTQINKDQALLPSKALVLKNNYGTAAGMWMKRGNTVFVSMPGVPYEMKGIMLEEVIPRLKEKFSLKSIYHKTALTQGIGESFLAEIIYNWENSIRSSNLSLAYLPSPGLVKLRITSYRGEEDKKTIDAYFDELKNLIPEALYGFENDSLPQIIGEMLRTRKMTIGTVESCTSGLLASQICSISGASDYFMGSLLTYSNSLKIGLADVSPENIEKFGAVSEEVVKEMAIGGRKKLGVDCCISTSGIAGPNGGTDEKPVGLVWIAIALPTTTIVKKFQFGDNRERTIQMTVSSALNYLRYELEST